MARKAAEMACASQYLAVHQTALQQLSAHCRTHLPDLLTSREQSLVRSIPSVADCVPSSVFGHLKMCNCCLLSDDECQANELGLQCNLMLLGCKVNIASSQSDHHLQTFTNQQQVLRLYALVQTYFLIFSCLAYVAVAHQTTALSVNNAAGVLHDPELYLLRWLRSLMLAAATSP